MAQVPTTQARLSLWLWVRPGPAQVISGIWEANQWIGDLYRSVFAFQTIFFSFFFKNRGKALEKHLMGAGVCRPGW